MPIWIKKKLSIGEWGVVQFRMLGLQQAMKQPLHLAMLLRPAAGPELDEIFLVLPDPDLMAHFPGFMEISEASIPDNVSLLVGEKSTFEKRFPDTAEKLVPRISETGSTSDH